ncbi:MAG: septal ring lytic transglycosylase RlpA family protein [Betaproteobacteria bacterium]|nr:septal ring lytic transglycosylase RlpA family protein [Betaproteobacteria bacterium]
MNQRLLAVGLVALLLAGCAGAPRDRPTEQTPRRGGYYQNDGPGDDPPANLEAIADAQPRYEPLHRFANRPYSVLGRDYVPAQSHRPHREQGIASWYGRQFHGKKTAIGETYDMYAMTAAHPTLPLPSYARVTHLASQKRVVVRVNDRGPFHPGRVIDLSYVAAHKLGLAQKGSAEVLVEALLPGGEGSAPTPAVAQAPAEAMEQVPLPMALERSGYFLQLGAFGNFANAESFLKHVQAQVVWLGESAHIAPREGLYRVQMGPYPDAAEARRIGELVREAMNLEANLRKD